MRDPGQLGRRAISLCAVLCLIAEGFAQELSVYSDLIVLAEKDRDDLSCEPAPEARSLEVLSPVLRRGSQLTLMLVVRAKAGTAFAVDIGQNPAEMADFHLYRYFPGVNWGNSFFTQPLEEVTRPLRGRISEGQRCAIFFLQIEAKPGAAAVERLKVEPAAWTFREGIDEFWSRYPLEVRLTGAASRPNELPLEECEAPLRSVAQEALRAAEGGCRLRDVVCRTSTELTVGSLLTRQYRADFGLPGTGPVCGGEIDESDLLKRIARERARGLVKK